MDCKKKIHIWIVRKNKHYIIINCVRNKLQKWNYGSGSTGGWGRLELEHCLDQEDGIQLEDWIRKTGG